MNTASQISVTCEGNGCRGHVSAAALALGIDDLLQILGYRQTAPNADNGAPPPVSASLAKTAAELLARGRELLEPAFLWQIIPVTFDTQRDALLCAPPYSAILTVGRLIQTELRGSLAVAAFVVTTGARLEQEARALIAAGHLLEGFVLDAVGSLAAEATADVLHSEVAARVRAQGWSTTNRFSPGYCTWETAGQQALFSLLPAQPAGVALHDSSLMTPLKSISGVIGLGPHVAQRPYRCDLCTMTDCHARRLSPGAAARR